MSSDHPLDRLIATFDPAVFQRALLEAYRIGKADGEAEVRANLMKVLAPANLTIVTPAENRSLAEADEAGESTERAPRGLTRQVVAAILDQEPGLTMPEIQKRAVLMDSRVSEKTVYNEINREKGKLYQQNLGRWRLVRPPPSEGGSLWQNEEGGQAVSG